MTKVAVSAMAFALLAGTPSVVRGDARCRVRGANVTLEAVTIKPNGAPAFKLGLVDAAVEATVPPSANRPVALSVSGPLAFRASRENVWFTAAAVQSAADGVVRLRRGARLVDVHADGDAVVGSVVIRADDVMPGENRRPDETAGPIRIPCASLSLNVLDVGADAEPDEVSRKSSVRHEVWWKLRGQHRQVEVFARPGGGSRSALVKSVDCDSCLEFRQVKQQGRWIKVERRGEGVAVVGWIRRDHLERQSEDVGGDCALGCQNDHGPGGWGEGAIGPPVRHYEGPAVVRAGTRVYERPSVGEWAQTRADVHVTVRHDEGSRWVELRSIPGLDGWPSGSPWFHAYVPVDAVSIPSATGHKR